MKINSVSPNPSVNISNTQTISRQASANTSSKDNEVQASNSETLDVQQVVNAQKSAPIDTDEFIDPEKEKELMAKSIEQANHTLKNYDRFIERSVHEVTKTVMYTIKDTKTKEIIAEYPPKKIQDMIAKMWELAGLVVDKRV